ncbi:regulator of G-protein signaling [Trifolium repens]|nr:regulator of G-protein signaling [Trifolium repens]
MLSSFPSKCMVLVFSYLLEYNFTGAAMEINISHRSRTEILSTSNLPRADLFHNALNEIVQLMKKNLAKDYWSSMLFHKVNLQEVNNSAKHIP